MKEAGWEIASHGLKWIDYKDFSREAEQEHLSRAVALHKEATGAEPPGFYLGRCSMNTLDLVMQHGGFLYSSDSYADDLPYWVQGPDRPQLMIPYTLDTNDMRFATAQGFNSGEQFFTYLKDSFDVLRREGEAGQPKMLSIGLHCRLAGRPGRAQAVARFADYLLAQQAVWIARRIDIARHWQEKHPPGEQGSRVADG